MKQLFLLLAACGGMALQAASLNYNLLVDTAALNGTGGQISAQFSQGGTDAATATLSLFSGATLGSFTNSGSASGNLSTIVTILNDAGLNENLQNVTFGNGFQLFLSITGPLIDNPQDFNGSTFALQLISGNVTTLLAQIDVLPGFDPLVTLDPSVTVDENVIPEPATGLLIAAAAPALWYWKRRR